jgi:hypothetical protein
MKRILFGVIICLIFSVSTLAVDLTLDKNEYSSSEQVSISVSSCSGTSLLKIKNPDGDMITIQQGSGNWQTSYNTNSDSSSGKYSLQVNCEDATSMTKFFCVNSAGCFVPAQETEESTTPSNFTQFNQSFQSYYEDYLEYKEEYLFAIDEGYEETFDEYYDLLKDLRIDLKMLRDGVKDYFDVLNQNPDNNSLEMNQTDNLKDDISALMNEIKDLYNENKFSASEVDPDCTPDWLCSLTWSPCNVNNQQTRSCTDKKGCMDDITEIKPCGEVTCVESWSCAGWGECKDSKQTRTCIDLNDCTTIFDKPEENQDCEEIIKEAEKSLSQKSVQKPDSQETQPSLSEDFEEETPSLQLEEKDNFVAPILIGSSLLVLIIIGVLLYLLYFGPKMKTAAEIKGYVQKERDKGISDQKIKSALLKSGWKESSVKSALKQ